MLFAPYQEMMNYLSKKAPELCACKCMNERGCAPTTLQKTQTTHTTAVSMKNYCECMGAASPILSAKSTRTGFCKPWTRNVSRCVAAITSFNLMPSITANFPPGEDDLDAQPWRSFHSDFIYLPMPCFVARRTLPPNRSRPPGLVPLPCTHHSVTLS